MVMGPGGGIAPGRIRCLAVFHYYALQSQLQGAGWLVGVDCYVLPFFVSNCPGLVALICGANTLFSLFHDCTLRCD